VKFLSLRRSILIVLLTFVGQVSFSQAFNFQELSIQQGLPQSQAYAILFDSTQHAWIGTQGGGLCRYDGEDFDYFTKSDSLISNRVYCLAQLNDEIYVGQKGGISVFDLKGNFTVNFRLPRPASIVQDVLRYEGEILCATDNGLYYINKGQLKKVEDNPSVTSSNIYRFFVEKENLWLCTNSGLLNFKDPLKKLNNARGLSSDQVQCVTEFGDYWVIGTYGQGVDVYSPLEGVLKVNPFESLENHIVLSLYAVDDQELWVGTLNNGVYVYSRKDGSLRNFNTDNGLSNNHIKSITADYWGNIWIGTSGGGVSVFQNSPFVEYNNSSGLNGNYVYSVLNTSKNSLWSSTEGNGVVRINDTSVVVFDEEYGFVSEKVKAIFEDNQGDIWFGTEGQGLGVYSQYDGKDTVYRYNSRNGLNSNWVKCFTQNNGRNSKIYIGTAGAGILEVNQGVNFPLNASFKKVKSNGDQIPDRISSLNFINNELWFTSSENNYGYYSNGQARVFSNSKGAFRNCIGLEDQRWLGSVDNGIMVLKMYEDSIVSKKWITESEGLSSNNIYQLVLKQNEIWVGTERGLDRLILDSLLNVSSIQHFGFEEGFEGVETNINAASVDKAGRLWFGTVEGLYQYQGGEVNYNQRKPPVLSLDDFSIFYESIESTEFASYFEDGKMIQDLVLPYDKNHIGFSFKAIHYTYSKNILFRWQLVGADKDWTPPTKVNTATYSNLNPGKYTFKLQASIDEDWDTDPIILEFEIDQPYYEKFWFKVMYYAVIGFILLLIILIIIYRIKKKNKALTEKFEMEKNMIELEQQALRLQMNPHFIFNVLTSIHNLIILNDSGKARYALAKFSKLMRRVLENSREKFISIDDEIETLENYVQLEKLTANLDITLNIDIDESVDSGEEILPPLMIQPFVENSIIHGLKELTYPGEINVGFKLLNDHLLECFIEDNGRGRAKAAQINAQKENYHKSTALQVTQERLANLNKDAKFVPFEIIDLKDDDGNPNGTKVIMRIVI
jgi:ligand-binding sensor domain-containing protein